MTTRRTHAWAVPDQLKLRIANLRKRIIHANAQALLITNPKDIRYLTGFAGDDSWALITARAGKPHVLSDFRFQEQIQREAPHVKALIRSGSLVDELVNLSNKLGLERLALQPEHVSISLRGRLAGNLGSVAFVEADDGMIEQRAIKDETEITLIRQALRITHKAFQRLKEQIRPGQKEQELAARLAYEMRVLGADGPSFPSIVAVGANSSLPHAVPGRTKVRNGQIILVDWGAKLGGYCGDLTRVLALGKMPTKLAEIYAIVLEAQLQTIAAIAPGKSFKEIDQVARGIITKAGYGDHFGHGTGHGIGLDIHEQPVLSWRVQGELQPGQVVTVEPGIYLPGVGGVRIEDDVLVTSKGFSVLSDLPKDLESAII